MGHGPAIMAETAGTATPSELYRRWEQQQWTAQSVDLALDRRQWLELSEEERWQWYWLAGFSNFQASESHAVVCMAKLLPYLPTPDAQHYLATQIADEARHAYFFERFHEEVLAAALPTQMQNQSTMSPAYRRLFIDWPTEMVDTAASRPCGTNVAVAAFHFFVVLEGSVALASFSVIRRLLTKTARFPGLLEGMTHAQRDEVRHAQFGISVLRNILAAEPAARDVVIAHMRDVLPLFSEVLNPRPARKALLETLGLDPYERRRRAFGLLQRNLQALDIGEVALVDPLVAEA